MTPILEHIPACPEVPSVQSTGQETREYRIELVTPMFGGGVELRENDPSFPIRPTSIRGQLQFWWRATVGAQCATLAELRAAQTEIWGSTERASRVDVLVDDVQPQPPTPTPCAKIEWNRNARQGQGAWRINWQAPFNGQGTSLPYVLFPFQGEAPPPNQNASIDVPPAARIQQASFRLVIRCPKDLWPQVEPAVWAWVNFGGLGGRTRRGCGAITGRQMNPERATIMEFAPRNRDELIEHCKRFVQSPSEPREWPTLATAILVGDEQPNAIVAWDQVIGRFRQFRQGVELGRNPKQQPNRPGRSRFPEPDTIRRATQKWKGSHKPDDEMPDAFPRAELGLPIVFHFKDDRNGDPPDTVLYPSNDSDGKPLERMASPLILKPLVLSSGKTVPLILQLKTADLAGVDLRQKVQGQEQSLPLPQPTLIRDPDLSTYRDSPLAWSPNGSALEAFLKFADSQGFEEVTR